VLPGAFAINDFHGNLMPPPGGIQIPDPENRAKKVTVSLMGLDLSSVGNHEFDKGKIELLRMQYGGCHAAARDRIDFTARSFTISRPTSGPIKTNSKPQSAEETDHPATGPAPREGRWISD
jgi:hypothetical protein